MSNGVSQPSPQAGTGGAILRFGVQSSWSTPPANFGDIHFLRSWFEYDSEAEPARPRQGINWYAILGLLLVLGVSAAFWTGVGMIATRLWK